MNVIKEQLEPLVHIVKTDERAVPIRHIQLVVVVQVVRSTNDGNNTTKIVLAKPNDFFLSTNAAVIGAETARTLANGEFVFNDPGEVSWGNSKGPLAP